MIALLQRVAEARVEVGGVVIGAIGRGLLLFVCAEPADTDDVADRLAAKVLKLRIFADAAGRLHPIVAAGRFGADMQVSLVNDGPVTIPLTVR